MEGAWCRLTLRHSLALMAGTRTPHHNLIQLQMFHKDTRLNCGHLLCRRCSEQVVQCPHCRGAIVSRERAFL